MYDLSLLYFLMLLLTFLIFLYLFKMVRADKKQSFYRDAYSLGLPAKRLAVRMNAGMMESCVKHLVLSLDGERRSFLLLPCSGKRCFGVMRDPLSLKSALGGAYTPPFFVYNAIAGAG